MRVIVGLLLAAAFVGAMVFAIHREAQVECQVCQEFRGASACRTSAAVDRNSAISGAVTAACAVLSGGVTDGIRCGATRPRSVTCDD